METVAINARVIPNYIMNILSDFETIIKILIEQYEYECSHNIKVYFFIIIFIYLSL